MAHRALIVFTFAFVTVAVTACGGAISETSSNVSQAQQGASSDAPATPPPPPPSDEAPPPCDGDRPPPPPPPPPRENGGICGACIDEHFVCCSAPEPCAGYCVPDCRPAPERCPSNTACDQGSGVCVRQ